MDLKTYSDLFQRRTSRLLVFLFLSILTIYPVLDTYSDCQNLLTFALDETDDDPADDDFHFCGKWHPLTQGHSPLDISDMQNMLVLHILYHRFTRSLIPINEIKSAQSFHSLTSGLAPPSV